MGAKINTMIFTDICKKSAQLFTISAGRQLSDNSSAQDSGDKSAVEDAPPKDGEDAMASVDTEKNDEESTTSTQESYSGAAGNRHILAYKKSDNMDLWQGTKVKTERSVKLGGIDPFSTKFQKLEKQSK